MREHPEQAPEPPRRAQDVKRVVGDRQRSRARGGAGVSGQGRTQGECHARQSGDEPSDGQPPPRQRKAHQGDHSRDEVQSPRSTPVRLHGHRAHVREVRRRRAAHHAVLEIELRAGREQEGGTPQRGSARRVGCDVRSFRGSKSDRSGKHGSSKCQRTEYRKQRDE